MNLLKIVFLYTCISILLFDLISIYCLSIAPSAAPGILDIQTFLMSFHLILKPLPEENHNGILLGYRVIVSNGLFRREVSNSTAYLRVENLQPFTTYNCTVTAYTSAGEGPFKELDVTTLSGME